jgi:hypothetical protein
MIKILMNYLLADLMINVFSSVLEKNFKMEKPKPVTDDFALDEFGEYGDDIITLIDANDQEIPMKFVREFDDQLEFIDPQGATHIYPKEMLEDIEDWDDDDQD